jgi:hypothetical protein
MYVREKDREKERGVADGPKMMNLTLECQGSFRCRRQW